MFRFRLLTLSFLLVLTPALLWAADEEDEDSLDGALDDLDDLPDLPEEDGPGSSGPEGDGTEGDAADTGFRLGNKDMRDQQDEPGPLPPEPPADGIAGNWYLMDVSCIDCKEIIRQKVVIDSPIEVIRGFNDQFTIDPGKTTGSFVEPSAERKRPTLVKDMGDGRFLFLVYNRGEGSRLTDTYAQLWDLQMHAGDKLLFGRYYMVVALTDAAWREDEKGFTAFQGFLGPEKLMGLVDLSLVADLTKQDNYFEFSDDARIEFAKAISAIRSDFDPDLLAAEQKAIRDAKEAEERRVAEIKGRLAAAKDAIKAGAWRDCIESLQHAHKLGFESEDTHYNLAKCADKVDDFALAETHFLKVLETAPKDNSTLFRLADLYERQGRLKEAMGLYKRIEKASPEGSDDWKDAHYRRLDLLDKLVSEEGLGQ